MAEGKKIRVIEGDILCSEVVSIVMPVRNTPAACLRRAVASVFAQTYNNIELIVVDDGSDDPSTLQELKRLESHEDAVCVLHENHAGASGARNTGIEHATGIWLAFIDSDDELLPNFLCEALRVAHSVKDCDLVIGGNRRLYSENEKALSDQETRDGFLKYQVCKDAEEINLIKEDMLAMSPVKEARVFGLRARGPVSKLYRLNRILDVRFDARLQQGEDRFFNFQYLDRCRTVCIVNADWYIYYQNGFSAVRSRHDLNYWKKNIDAMLSADISPRFSSAVAASVCNTVLAATDGLIGCWSHSDWRLVEALFAYVRESGCLSTLDIGRYAFPFWRKKFYEFVRNEWVLPALLLLESKRLFNLMRGRRLLT